MKRVCITLIGAACLAGCGGQKSSTNAAGTQTANASAAAPAANNAAAAYGAAPAGGAVAIPAEYHGQWAEKAADCSNRTPTTTALRIDAQGWTGWEESGRVTEALPAPAGGGHSFREMVQVGADEEPATLTLRRVGEGLIIEEQGTGPAGRATLVRC